MRILSKVKDYYDYLQDWSDDIVFVRKQLYSFDSWRDIFCHFPVEYFYNLKNKNESRQILALRVGFKIYFFRAKIYYDYDRLIRYNGRSWVPNDSSTKFEIEYIGSRLDYEYSNIEEPLKWQKLDRVCSINKKREFVEEDVLSINLNNIKIIDWRYDKYAAFAPVKIKPEYYIPYLSNTVSSYIPAEEVYRNIDDFLRSSKNDKNWESKGITDIEKIINHGFDKKSSFRNIL